MAPGEPILIVCHSFPPNAGIGGRRWAKFAKELARRGHPVHVIRSESHSAGIHSLWTADGATPGIIAHPLPQRYPDILVKSRIITLLDKLKYRFWLHVLPLFTQGNYYDPAFLWKRQLLKKAAQLIAENEIRNVIVTGAPFSLLVHATQLKTRFPRIHLVGDIRDPWTWGNSYGFQTIGATRRARERRNEARVVEVFDKITAPSGAILDHLQATYREPPLKYAMLPHVIDRDEIGQPRQRSPDGSFRIIYAGSLYDRAEADLYFIELMKAFQRLRQDYPEKFHKCRLDLYLTGYGTTDYIQAVNDQGLQDTIHFHDPVPPKVILDQIANADLVLAFISSEKKDIMVTKLNEIFYLHRPLLHIGAPGLVSRSVLERRLGGSLQVDELATELPRIIAGERKLELDPNADLSEFLLERVTDKLLKTVLN